MDKFQQIRTFLAVAEQGSFVAAANTLGLSPQLVSKYVAALEADLGSRLLNRTTRRVNMTEAGAQYFAEASELVEALERLESHITLTQQSVRGVLRVSAPVSLGSRFLGEAVQCFQQEHPEVSVDIQLNDRKVDIVEEGFDIALRIARLKDSSLVARKLSEVPISYCAAPSYLKVRGTPRLKAELQEHRLLRYSYLDGQPQGGSEVWLGSNSGDFLVDAARAGAGIVSVPKFMVRHRLELGQLEEVLCEAPREVLGLYAVYPHRALLPLKVRSFSDHLAQHFNRNPL